jgi:phage repressor protein C with HTH and peptisase S24 domain
MLTHEAIWSALDALAKAKGMSASGLAKKAGLDATTFNKSKRVTPDGRARWPSTESVAKALEAAGASFDDFVAMVGGAKSGSLASRRRALPLLGFAQAGDGGFFDDGGFPVGAGWDEVSFPDVADEKSYALEIAGDSMAPVYRDGDVVIVSPAAPVRRGDRVVVRTQDGEVLAKELKRKTAKTVELKSLNREHPDRVFKAEEIAWIARIIWSSQ